ncbi:MAG TPA: DUF3618 domain-containing protein [Streptosporangiaceae bacterium]
MSQSAGGGWTLLSEGCSTAGLVKQLSEQISTQEPLTATDAAPSGSVPGSEQGLREGIERIREQLGGTVEQLAAKVDVKTRPPRASAS